MMYRQPINQFMASPQAAMGGEMINNPFLSGYQQGNSPLQVGAKINQFMSNEQSGEPTPNQDMFSQFNPGMMGLNMLMNNGMSPQPQNLLQSMPFNSLLSDINPMYKGLSGLFSR